MKLEELLRHVADNVENGRDYGHGLLYKGLKEIVTYRFILQHNPEDYTLAPRMVRINGIEVKAGMSEAPRPTTEYYLVNISGHEKLIDDFTWSDDDFDFTALKRGLVFPHTEQGRQDAIAMAKAMLSFEEV